MTGRSRTGRWTLETRQVVTAASSARVLVLAALLVLAACAGAPPATATSRQALGVGGSADAGQGGSDAPLALSFPSLAGGAPHSLASDRGHVVVLHAFATWCAPCMQALPRLATLARTGAPRGLRTYVVSVDEDASQIPSFLAAARVELPVLLDRGGFTVEKSLGLRVMPTTWLLDRTGRVRGRYDGPEAEAQRLSGDVERLLAESP